MENTSYALHIAVGVLIAIAILSLVIFRWRQIGSLEKAKDEAVVIKNKADFNKEFEVYNKGLLSGAEVLSCLNKAQNNNQKYVYNNYYGTDSETIGSDERKEFFIDVEVTLNSPLYDDVKVYYKDNKGKYQRLLGGVDATYKTNFSDKIFGGDKVSFDIPQVTYYYFKKGKLYQESKDYVSIMWEAGKKSESLYNILNSTDGVGKIETKLAGNETYELLASDEKGSNPSSDTISDIARLSALITTVSLKNQVIYNDDPSPSDSTGKDWWYCTWTTAASDFKTRKFKCKGSEYNIDTGYIEKLTFEEIKNN